MQAARRTLTACAALIAGFAMNAGQAQAQKFIQSSKDWNVYTVKQDGKKVCYISSAPVKKSGNYKNRGEPYALVTSRRSNYDELSVSSGYPYTENGEVNVHIDGVLYKLFTKGDLAWAYDENQDSTMVRAMKKGSKMTVRGSSKLGTYSLDTYSLKGFTGAYKKMKSLCK